MILHITTVPPLEVDITSHDLLLDLSRISAILGEKPQVDRRKRWKRRRSDELLVRSRGTYRLSTSVYERTRVASFVGPNEPENG